MKKLKFLPVKGMDKSKHYIMPIEFDIAWKYVEENLATKINTDNEPVECDICGAININQQNKYAYKGYEWSSLDSTHKMNRHVKCGSMDNIYYLPDKDFVKIIIKSYKK